MNDLIYEGSSNVDTFMVSGSSEKYQARKSEFDYWFNISTKHFSDFIKLRLLSVGVKDFVVTGTFILNENTDKTRLKHDLMELIVKSTDQTIIMPVILYEETLDDGKTLNHGVTLLIRDRELFYLDSENNEVAQILAAAADDHIHLIETTKQSLNSCVIEAIENTVSFITGIPRYNTIEALENISKLYSTFIIQRSDILGESNDLPQYDHYLLNNQDLLKAMVTHGSKAIDSLTEHGKDSLISSAIAEYLNERGAREITDLLMGSESEYKQLLLRLSPISKESEKMITKLDVKELGLEDVLNKAKNGHKESQKNLDILGQIYAQIDFLLSLNIKDLFTDTINNIIKQFITSLELINGTNRLPVAYFPHKPDPYDDGYGGSGRDGIEFKNSSYFGSDNQEIGGVILHFMGLNITNPNADGIGV
jgi:hypothetical protein